jgi:uncharacterized repeat protein (TIGR01451 family)
MRGTRNVEREAKEGMGGLSHRGLGLVLAMFLLFVVGASATTIQGIQVDIKAGAPNPETISVQLLKAGSPVGSAKSATIQDVGGDCANTTWHIFLGGATDLWGESWSAADIDNAGFGVRIVSTSNGSKNVDAVKITIYTDAGTFGPRYAGCSSGEWNQTGGAIGDPAIDNGCANIGATGKYLDLTCFGFSISCTPPSITTQPQSQTACAGSSVMFSVTATGTAPLSYQWQKLINGTWTNISGATSSTYSINSVTTADAGSYRIVVSNACGEATSNAATLTVNTAPSITQHPQSQTVCAGSSVSFSVGASGTAPLSYQWQKLINGNWTNISGATSSTYSIDPVTTDDAGSYRVVVSNACGEATSNAATLTVNTAPSITCQDITVSNESGKCGAVVTWSVTATGNPTPTVSCNPSSGTFFPVGTTTVTCTATNSCGTATCSFNVTVRDSEPPQITCPGNITKNVDQGTCGASVSFAATATDNCGTPTIKYYINSTEEITSPYTFPVGTTTVQVVATDIHGNKSECTFTVTVKPSADLEIKKEAPAQVVAGESLTYKLTITNNGPCSATNVVVTDTLPSEITEAKYMVNGTPQGDWTGNYTIDTLEPGLTVTITITGKVAPWATGTLTNTARVTSGTYDPDDKNNTATSTTTVEIQADISVTKKVSPTIAKPGDTITYTIEVTNNGPSDAPNVVVTDTLPQYITGATYEVDGTDKGNWTGSYTIGRMKPGDTVTITITGTVSSGASGTLTNTVVVELKPAQVGGQAGNDPEPGNNEDTATIIFAFYTGFEGWVSNGLWYIRRDNGGCFRCDKIQGEYVQFAKLEDCISRTYNLGTSRAYGVLTSPVIRPPAGATGWVMISIDFYRQVEKERPTGDYDRTYVQLSINGGSWQTIWSRSSRNGSEECGTITYVIQSMPKYFQIRFIFDSVDYRYNNYKGWAIDNVWAAVVPVGTQAKGEELLAGDLTSELTVINVPNPITDVHTTTFKVLGPLADSVERIRVRIFDLSGKLVWEGETAGNALEWHTTDFLGRYLANGVYLYQVQVYVGGTWITSDLQKLAIYR